MKKATENTKSTFFWDVTPYIPEVVHLMNCLHLQGCHCLNLLHGGDMKRYVDDD